MTKYPLVLVHGLGFHDKLLFINYWGRIASSLQAAGVDVHYGDNDAWGTIHDSALRIGASIDRVLEETGARKVNVIAHSRGGLDCRYLISSLAYAGKIASLSTVSAPHHGSHCLNIMHVLPERLVGLASFFVNLEFRILGDRHPKFGPACKELSEISIAEFNAANLDEAGVYYQSFGVKLESPFDGLMFFAMNTILSIFDGENDGIVSYDSMKWTNFRPMLPPGFKRGLSHADVVDLRRRDRFGFDIRGFYKGLVADLAARGF